MIDTGKIAVLLVEDDPNLSLVLRDFLEMMGYKVTLCNDGEEGLAAFRKYAFDLCIFDVMLPRKDGFSLAKDIREADLAIPLIFLTAKSLKDDRVKGFTIGCDDYITKPFSTEELDLRIKAILKRCMLRNGPQVFNKNFKIGKFNFDAANMLLTLGDNEKRLTRKEAALLKLLCEYRNQLLPREVALKKIWGDNDYFVGRSMDVFIVKLRKYLKADPDISIINVHGTGFKLVVDDQSGKA